MTITADSIEAAAERISGRIRCTPVLKVQLGTFGLPYDITLKLEHTQITGSFKVRGAFNTLLSQDHAGRDVVAISGGNHGAAVAYAATQLGLSSTVFVPRVIAKPEKVKRMEAFGAEVRLVGGTHADVFAAYESHAAETGALAVHPYDSPETLAGQGTLGLEIAGQAPELDTILLTVGGGGLFGGVANALAGRMKVVTVETEETALLDRALREGPEVQITPGGIAASSLGASTIGKLAYETARRLKTETVVVPDRAVLETGRRLWEDARMVVEPGAAAALAALVHGAYRPAPAERVGIILCGGNADPDWFV
jgi:threonine dehydratase